MAAGHPQPEATRSPKRDPIDLSAARAAKPRRPRRPAQAAAVPPRSRTGGAAGSRPRVSRVPASKQLDVVARILAYGGDRSGA